MKTVTVKDVKDTGKTWTSKEGKTFKIFNITTDDGITGTTMSGKFVAGKQAVVDIKESEYNGITQHSFKYLSDPANPQPAFGGKQPFVHKSQNESFGLSYAKDLAIAHINN